MCCDVHIWSRARVEAYLVAAEARGPAGQILYPEPVFADRWVRMPNSHEVFGGRPALSVMTEAGIDGLYRVRRLLDGRRGGWN
jgi:hypothetical protein